MKQITIILGSLFLIALCLRLYDASYPSFQWMDERYHVSAAVNYWQNGQFEPEMWEHPPLRHIMLKGFLEVFGDNPLGWRIRNILSGAAVALLTFFLAHEICGSRRTALLAGLLIATDPLHIVLSRFTFDEIYGSFFSLSAIVLYMKSRHRDYFLALSAICIGCALAIKWNYVPTWFLLIILALRENGLFRDKKTASFIIVTYLFIPLTIYILSYLPWLSRGYSLGELAELIRYSYISLQKWSVTTFDQSLFFTKHPNAYEWFVRPVMVGQGTYSGVGEGRGEFILYINNIPVWIFTIPALISMTVISIKRRSLQLAMPALFFFSTYLLYLTVNRPIFIYTAATLLPFAFIAVAFCITHIAERFSAWIYYGALVMMLGWNLYLYPLVTAKKVPVAAYRFILERADINQAR